MPLSWAVRFVGGKGIDVKEPRCVPVHTARTATVAFRNDVFDLHAEMVPLKL
jgi:hypothetical protein